jgi:hypothetical protein
MFERDGYVFKAFDVIVKELEPLKPEEVQRVLRALREMYEYGEPRWPR